MSLNVHNNVLTQGVHGRIHFEHVYAVRRFRKLQLKRPKSATWESVSQSPVLTNSSIRML